MDMVYFSKYLGLSKIPFSNIFNIFCIEGSYVLPLDSLDVTSCVHKDTYFQYFL